MKSQNCLSELREVSFNKLKAIIRDSWSENTCYPPDLKKLTNTKNLAVGQCAVTALFINELFKGLILYNKKYNHYWNILPDGTRIDLTRQQFKKYSRIKVDKLVNRDEILNSVDAMKFKTKTRYKILRERICQKRMKIKQT